MPSIWSPVAVNMSLAQGFTQLGAGLAVGLAGLAAGFAIGIVGDAGVRGTAQQPRLFVGMVCLFVLCCNFGIQHGYPDSYPHFRRSVGFIRSHCCPYHEYLILVDEVCSTFLRHC